MGRKENIYKDISLKVANYKCFGETPQGFEKIRTINLIIGRNNSGKTALLEMLEFSVITQFDTIPELLFHKGKPTCLYFEGVATEDNLKIVFRDGIQGGGVPGYNQWQYGSKWINCPIKWKREIRHPAEFIEITPPFEFEGRENFEKTLADSLQNKNFFTGKRILRLSAERNLVPEGENNEITVQPNGQGATALIHQILTFTKHDQELVSKDLLKQLNSIVSPDMDFIGIYTKRNDTGSWEIYLEEEGKGLVPLAHTGSGLKTIILVLVLMKLIPTLDNIPRQNIIYAFEELENYLHPALQRRLLAHIRDVAHKEGSLVFITTHSNVAIDMFSRDENAQIIHVKHDGTSGNTQKATTYIDYRNVIDDLDIRASDLLQANSIIWVEGPSDRIYLNRWIDLFSEGKIKEGEHYQIIFYGGRLLSHLSAANPEEIEELISMLRINSNAAIIIDSDKRNSASVINKTKKRLQKEINDIDGFCWITNGKEIENYIPHSVLRKLYPNKTIPQLNNYIPINETLDQVAKDAGKKYLQNKVMFAETVAKEFDKKALENTALKKKLELLCKAIKKWNKEPE